MDAGFLKTFFAPSRPLEKFENIGKVIFDISFIIGSLKI